ncbi:MAG: hypothetical protein Q4C01_05910 [Clostridia bacterium]|nr:hypothetical protein [Clostridia bacterium]
MKKRVFLCVMAALAVSFAACDVLFINASSVPKGYLYSEEHWDPSGFQDYTDYCKYIYASKEEITKNDGYTEVGEADIESIKGYFDNFGDWMKASDRLDEYDFDSGCINAGDYVKIVDKSLQLYDNYTVYFFDTDTLTLYYIHSNI